MALNSRSGDIHSIEKLKIRTLYLPLSSVLGSQITSLEIGEEGLARRSIPAVGGEVPQVQACLLNGTKCSGHAENGSQSVGLCYKFIITRTKAVIKAFKWLQSELNRGF